MDKETYVPTINDQLKDHISTADDWAYQDLAQKLYKWGEVFNKELFGESLSTPAIQIENQRVNTLGSYRIFTNGFGLDHEITLNQIYVERPFECLLETLLHEMIHEWQKLYGKQSKSNYHNKEFRLKALSFGLVVNAKGQSLGVIRGSFTKLLEKYGIDIINLKTGSLDSVPKERKSNQKKWSCGCTNIRAYTEVRAKCMKCGNMFKLAPPSW